MLLSLRTIWPVILLLIGITFSITNGNTPESGCDLTLTQPCNSNASLCVPLEHVGDGVLDCPDGSDEACEEWQHECLCGFPRCIDKAKVGDGVLDCVEGSDELAIEKESYICPPDLLKGQELLRRKRQIFEKQARREVNKGVITNYYSISSGVTPALGVLTSTVDSFVNKGTTSEYFTSVEGTSINGSYAQVTSLSSRTFFALPTRLQERQVNGLVSSLTKTTVSNGYTETIVSRIYHTNIDGTYAQLVETETKGFSPKEVNYVTILQGEELHGTFHSLPENSLATLKFSHLESSLNPEPVAEEIVTVTGTYGKFIRDGLESQTTYSVFTGSYVKDYRTYIFFFGNSALPNGGNVHTENKNKVTMKRGSDKRKVILDMEKDMEVIMPSELEMLNMASKSDFLIGEGIIDGHKLDGLFIADSDGFDVKGAHKRSGGDIKMLTVTIGQPSTIIKKTSQDASPHTLSNITFFGINKAMETEKDNEVDSSLLRGRKADIHGNEIIIEAENIRPTRPLPLNLPTFVIEEPNQNIGDILLRDKIIKMSKAPATSIQKNKDDNIVENIKAKFNIESGFTDSDKPTITYYGFADFTTTIADTVVVFTPNSKSNTEFNELSVDSNTLRARIAPTVEKLFHKTSTVRETHVLPTVEQIFHQTSAIHDSNQFSTVTTQVYNTVDLYPSGLVSSIGGTIVNDDMTTLFTTLVYGTYIQGQYAQVVRSTSSIFYLVSRSPVLSAAPTHSQDIVMTKTPDSPITEEPIYYDVLDNEYDTVTEDIFESIFKNSIGRSVDGESKHQGLNNVDNKNVEKDHIEPSSPIHFDKMSTTTYTFYTTFVKDGLTKVATNYKTTSIKALFETVTKLETSSVLNTLTHHVTSLVSGTPIVSSRLEVVTSSIAPSSVKDTLINQFETDSTTPSSEITTEETNESVEATTEQSSQDITESPGFSLESSLNPEDEINALYFPRTYYTTYTYFTTYHRLNASSIVSSLETITNIISDDNQLEDYKSLTPVIPSYPVTYWTTYTYWTTLVKDNSSITTSSKKTISNVVHLTDEQTPTVTHEVLPIKPTSVINEQSSTPDVTTYYTTYTYYTTERIGTSTIISSRLETQSSIVTGNPSNIILNTKELEDPFGSLFKPHATESLRDNIITKAFSKSTTEAFGHSVITIAPGKTSDSLFDFPIVETDSDLVSDATEEPFSSWFNVLHSETPIIKATTETQQESFGSLFGLSETETLNASPKRGSSAKPSFGSLFDFSETKNLGTSPKTGISLFDLSVQKPIKDVNSEGDMKSFGLFDFSDREIPITTSKTGLLSTIRRSTVNEGLTTMYSTNIYGTYVDGIYMQIQSTTSEIVDPTSVQSNLKKTGVVKVNAGMIIENERTTHYTTQHIGTYVGGHYVKELVSTSHVDGNTQAMVTEVNPTKTGIVREIIGSIIQGTKTTYYHSTVLGTLIAGIYAQKVESTSRFVSGPSITFEILSQSSNHADRITNIEAPILESSIESFINPTPVITQTQNLEPEITQKVISDNSEISSKGEKKNRQTFPIRTSSKRRTDVFPFIRRTSSFRKEEALSKVLAAAPISDEVIKTKPKQNPAATESRPTPTRAFRFGNTDSQSTRRFRFQGLIPSKEKTSEGKVTKETVPPKILQTTESEQTTTTPTTAKPKEDVKETTEAFRQFRFRDKSSSTGTRSSLPIARKERPSIDSPREPLNKFRFGTVSESTTNIPKITLQNSTEASNLKVSKPISFLNRRTQEKRKNLRQQKPTVERANKINISTERTTTTTTTKPKIRPGGILPRRRLGFQKLNKEESNIDPVFLLPDGSSPSLHFDSETIEITAFTPDDVIDEKLLLRNKRKAENIGTRMTARGLRRSARNKDTNSENSDIIETEKIAPSSPQKNKQQFTISNPRAAPRARTRGREAPKPQKPSISRPAVSRPSKSRNTLPFRPRGAINRKTVPLGNMPERGFRRPTTDSKLKISNRFNPNKKEEEVTQQSTARRQPPSNRNRAPAREPSNKNNPIQSFLERPKPPPKAEDSSILPKKNGDLTLDIVGELTVTREVPVTTTIPLLENGETVEKEVITASYMTEVIQPEQITQTEINGVLKLLLSTVESKQKVTQVFIQPIDTTTVTYTPVFIQGKRTSASHILSSTAYKIVTVTSPKNGNDVQDLLKLLLLQQQQQNPFLAAFGLNSQQVSTRLSTRTFVTSITKLESTEIPIIFRGKTIVTTVVDSKVEVITTTEITTETVKNHGLGDPLGNPNPLGQLLPLLLQNQLNRKAREVSPTLISSFSEIDKHEKKFDSTNSVDSSVLEKIIPILPTFRDSEEMGNVMITPSLDSYKENLLDNTKSSFLWYGPAEFAPLKRKVRSAERGNPVRQRIRVRIPGGRKIDVRSEDQVIQDDTTPDESVNADRKSKNKIKGPTTYFTTFTYYTTLIDDLNNEYVQSSEETITQVATFGVRLDDFTRTKPFSKVEAIDQTAISVQEKFTLDDAIIPGKPRPVPDPVFKEPEPPHGPVIRHDNLNNDAKLANQRKRKIIVRTRPHVSTVDLRRQRSKVRISRPVTVVPKISETFDHNRLDNTEEKEQITEESFATHEIMELEEKDIEETIQGKPDERHRVRITVTKKRPIRILDTGDIVDKTTIDSGGRKRVVITRRLPQPQPTAVASPVDPFVGTVSTFFTIYSYIYSIYKDSNPFSISTRVVTVSNSVNPTVVEVPLNYQTAVPNSNLYTIHDGEKTATLGERVENGYTTHIFLSSATLASVRPGLLHHSTAEPGIFEFSKTENHAESSLTGSRDLPRLVDLQSSFIEIEGAQTTSTPTFTIPSARETLKDTLKQPLRTRRPHLKSKQKETLEDNSNSHLFDSQINISRNTRRGTLSHTFTTAASQFDSLHHRRQNDSLERKHRLNLHARRTTQSPSITSQISLSPELEELITNIVATQEVSTSSQVHDIFANIFITPTETSIATTESTPIFEVADIPENIFKDFTETPISESPILPTPTRPPRPSIRRDDIPIVRRPSIDNITDQAITGHRLRFTTTTESDDKMLDFPIFDNVQTEETLSTEQPITEVSTEKAAIDELNDEAYYDDYYYYDDQDKPTGISPTPLPPKEATLDELKQKEFSSATTSSESPLDVFDFVNPEENEGKATGKENARVDQGTTQVSSTQTIQGSNVVYTTFITSTFLPILGGDQSITLTLLTSSLITLVDKDHSYNTASLESLDTEIFGFFSTSVLPISIKPFMDVSLVSTLALDPAHFFGTQPLDVNTSKPVLITKTTKEGREAFRNRGQDRFRASHRPNEGQVGIIGRQNLATKVMENGVEVIVAGENASPENAFPGFIRGTPDEFRTPITLPPSTLSNQMLMFASTPQDLNLIQTIPEIREQMFQFQTYFTTFTYYNTVFDDSGKPVVRSSKETISNIVSLPLGDATNFIERTKINLDTSTYLSTHTFTRTLSDLFGPEVVTSEEILTQVVVTEAPSVTRTKVENVPTYSTVITKTYYTTFTYYKTSVEGTDTIVNTETVVSSDVIRETSVNLLSPSLPVVTITKFPGTPDVDPAFTIFATKTYFTTSTYLTTILEGDETITSSHTEVSSNIVTEPIPSVLNTEELFSFSSAAYNVLHDFDSLLDSGEYERIGYIPLGGNIYKEMRTLFATYTHYTTLIDGQVKSNEVTKTELITSTISTTSVPGHLLIRGTNLFETPAATSVVQPDFASALFDSLFEDKNILLDPSYVVNSALQKETESLDSSDIYDIQSSYFSDKASAIRESSGLKATVHVKEGSESGTFVVQDSTTSATLFVRPPDKTSLPDIFDQIDSLASSLDGGEVKHSVVLASSPFSFVESTSTPLFKFDDFISSPVNLSTLTSVIEISTVLKGFDSKTTHINPGDTVIIVTKTNGEVITMPHVIATKLPAEATSFDNFGFPIVSPSLPIEILSTNNLESPTTTPSPVSDADKSQTPSADADKETTLLVLKSETNENNAAVSSSHSETSSTKTSEVDSKVPDKKDDSFGIGLSPVLTAVAGLIGNTFVGKLAAKTDINRRKIDQVILPKNAIIPAEKEPLLIPVGGVGASLSSSRGSTVQPEHGFIPLRRPKPNKPFASIFPDNKEFFEEKPAHPDLVITQPSRSISMEKFGPTFRPPIATGGFTAMTTDINPTKVSVISGEETIFFGGFDSSKFPQPSGNPDNSSPFAALFPTGVEKRNEENTSHLLTSFDNSEVLLHKGKEAFNIPRPTQVTMEDHIVYDSEDNIESLAFPDFSDNEPTNKAESDYVPLVLEATVGIGDAPVEETEFFDSDSTLDIGEDGRRTTVVRGSSTVMLGATTIFDSLFTRPLVTDLIDDDSINYSILQDSDDGISRYKTSLESFSHTVLATATHFDFASGLPTTNTEADNNSQNLRTLVTPVVDLTTSVDFNSILKNSDKTTNNFVRKTKLQTLTVPSNGTLPNLYDNSNDYADSVIPNEVNLGFEEENEVSRFVESRSPDQDVGEPHQSNPCSPECSTKEVCKSFRQEHVCVCKPGYSRRQPTDTCKKSDSFQLDVVLDRLSNRELIFNPQLLNKSHPNTQYLIKEVGSGIEKTLIVSDLGEKYHSSSIIEFDESKDGNLDPALVARVKIDLINEGDEKVLLGGPVFASGGQIDELILKKSLEDSLKNSNYSLGGGEVYARREPTVLAATDFDECQSEEHNDCHKDAICINVAGTFTCQCKEHFNDVLHNKDPRKGRHCIESNSCALCNYHGKCVENSGYEMSCECDDWFSGQHCEINMKVMLIAVVSVGAFLLLLLAIFIVFCCCKSKRDRQPGFLRASGLGEHSTLDRRAMIHDSSSESSEDVTKTRSGTFDGKLPPMPRTPQADYSIGRRSAISNISKDRSVTLHTTMPPVLIPRIKGYNCANRTYTLERENNGKFATGNLQSPEAALVDILEGNSRNYMPQDIERNDRGTASVHSLGGLNKDQNSKSRENLEEGNQRPTRHHHHHHHDSDSVSNGRTVRSRSSSRPRHHHHLDGATYRSRSSDRLDGSTQDLSSEFGVNSFRYGDRTVSQARSYDETTVRAPIRALRGESFRSRDMSSQVLSEGMPTNAERDGNSTIVYPPMQLYRPIREADSMSDLTGHKMHRNEFFE